MQKNNYVISAGHCKQLGATLEANGVNFAIWCPAAETLELLLFKDIDDTDPDIILLSSPIYRSTYYWHVFVEGLKAGQIYAFRIMSATRFYNSASNHIETGKVLLDPYGKRILFPKAYKRFQGNNLEENIKISAKNAVIDFSDYDWGIDCKPNHPLNRTVIYEMHVKGFTAHESSGLSEELRGTYKGMIEKIPYLVELGITAVELLPIFQYDKEDALQGHQNYWGYSPMGFFSIHEDYASNKDLMGPINEFRDLVKALHQNNIEVILDVVYNHTSEGDQNGPTYCFKGFDKQNYYIINDEGYYCNYSGCGNTFNATTSVVRNLILDSLIFWAEVMHVDGFRFDLASILSRNEKGVPQYNSATLLDIDANLRLADTKIIAEPWDAGGLYQLGSIAGAKWREWNGQFRDDVRAFLRGDEGLIQKFVNRTLGSPDIYNERKVDPQKSINFITCHDGFTLYDLVSYADKHNLDNGENNNDGNNCNYSANYGIEGETDNKAILDLRLRQCKNFMALTILSMGTPMVTMGDEVLRTQHGNNNAYCQDNEISYFNWNFTDRQKDMLLFTKKLIARRTRRSFVFARYKARQYFMLDNVLKNSKLQWHGVKPFQPDWSKNSHAIGIIIYWGDYNIYAYIFVNAYWEDLTVELPAVPGNVKKHWYMVVNTAAQSPDDAYSALSTRRFNPGLHFNVKARSLIMLVSPTV